MSDDMISKPRARRIRLISQVVAAVFLAIAATVIVVGIPFLSKPESDLVAFSSIESEANSIYQGIVTRRAETDGEVEELPADLESIQFALESVGNAPEIKVPEPVTPAGTQSTTDTPAASVSKTRFLGTIGIGDRLMALVSAGGGQRVLGAGDEATLALSPGDNGTPPTVRVKEISRDRLVLVENGTEQTLDRAARVGVSVSTSAATVSPPASAESNPGRGAARAFNDADQVKPVNPDDYRREDGTIDYEALRAAARERARQRQDVRRRQREESGDDN